MNKIEYAADLFSLGVTLYNLYNGSSNKLMINNNNILSYRSNVEKIHTINLTRIPHSLQGSLDIFLFFLLSKDQ